MRDQPRLIAGTFVGVVQCLFAVAALVQSGRAQPASTGQSEIGGVPPIKGLVAIGWHEYTDKIRHHTRYNYFGRELGSDGPGFDALVAILRASDANTIVVYHGKSIGKKPLVSAEKERELASLLTQRRVYYVESMGPRDPSTVVAVRCYDGQYIFYVDGLVRRDWQMLAECESVLSNLEPVALILDDTVSVKDGEKPSIEWQERLNEIAKRHSKAPPIVKIDVLKKPNEAAPGQER